MKKRYNIEYPFNNENGYTLIVVIMVLVVISILGISLIGSTATTLKHSTSQRDNQSAYYIAEAGISQERVKVQELAKEAFKSTKDLESIYIKNLQEKKPTQPFDFQIEFIKKAKQNINSFYIIKDTNTSDGANIEINNSDLIPKSGNVLYKEQKGVIPKSITTVQQDVQNSSPTKLQYTIKSTGIIGNNNKRTISQLIEISLNTLPTKKEIIVKDNDTIPPSNLNACYAVYTSGSINNGGKAINGDIYSTDKLTIGNNGSQFNGNVYSDNDIEINGSSGIKNVYSTKNITISNGLINESVYAKNSLTIKNGTVSGGVNANSSITVTGGAVGGSANTNSTFSMSNGTVSGGVNANGSITVTGGAVGGSANTNSTFSMSNGTISGGINANDSITATGGTIDNNLITKNSVLLKTYPTIKKDVIALNDITVTDWLNIGGKYKYGRNIKFNQNTNGISNSTLLTDAEKIKLMNQKMFDENLEYITNGGSIINNSCTSSIPKLDNSSNVFKSPVNVSTPKDEIIPGYNQSSTFDLIKDGSLNVTSGLANNKTITLDSDIYFKKIKIDQDYTLNIDLKGGNRSLYVDSLEIPQGHIKIVNPGTLNIYVLNSMNINGGSTINDSGKPPQTNIYYSGTPSISLAGGINVMGSLHVKNADLILTAGSSVKGDIYVYGNNTINVNGGTDVAEHLFLAPYSNIIHSNGIINGNIVAKNYTSSGGAIVNPPSNSNQSTNPGSSSGSTSTIKIDDYPEGLNDFLFVQSQIEEANK